MNTSNQHLFLSPHLDDVALSCGGTVASLVRGGHGVNVVTLFAGSPEASAFNEYTRELWERWGSADDPAAARRAEDLEAMRRLKAHPEHLEFLDCVYRLHPETGQALYPTVDHIFGDVHPAEETLPQELAQAIVPSLGHQADQIIYAPLTVGHHVDHILAQRVAFGLLRQGYYVSFYEDYPYAGDPKAMQPVFERWPNLCWTRERVELDDYAIAAKIDAVGCYESQISTFWSSEAEMAQAVREQAMRAGNGVLAENYWSLEPGCLP